MASALLAMIVATAALDNKKITLEKVLENITLSIMKLIFSKKNR